MTKAKKARGRDVEIDPVEFRLSELDAWPELQSVLGRVFADQATRILRAAVDAPTISLEVYSDMPVSVSIELPLMQGGDPVWWDAPLDRLVGSFLRAVFDGEKWIGHPQDIEDRLTLARDSFRRQAEQIETVLQTFHARQSTQ